MKTATLGEIDPMKTTYNKLPETVRTTALGYSNSATAMNLLHSGITLPSSVWGSDKTAALARLDAWLQAAQNMINTHYGTKFPRLNASSLEMSDGRRYIRIDRIDLDHNQTPSRSIHVFIDKKTGDILKAAGYKAPAKHARGNIFDASNGMSEMTPYGANYLR